MKRAGMSLVATLQWHRPFSTGSIVALVNAVTRYRPNHGAGLEVQTRKRQPLGLNLLCCNKPASSLTSEMQAPQRAHLGAAQDGGGERNLTTDPVNWLK
jgi:hypothetical protein